MTTQPVGIAIIGMGPRGLSVLERLCANIPELLPDHNIEIHVIDPYPIGAGSVWRTDQSKHLLMNTVASQVTVFTDESVDCEGPILHGPSLYEWAHALAATADKYEDWVLEEACALRPDSYPKRAFYGQYLQWVYNRLLCNAPTNVRVFTHKARVVSLDDHLDNRQVIRLDDGSKPLVVNAVVLALGHTSIALSDEEQRFQQLALEIGLCYIPPANPADVKLDNIAPGETVVLRGLGLNFFDYMALFTVGRGGRFIRANDRLVYKPSGREPRLFASSRRGVPYHARGQNQKGPYGRHQPQVLTLAVIDELHSRTRKGERINFRESVWPLIAKEVETLYYYTLIRSTEGEHRSEQFKELYKNCEWNSPEEKQILDEFGIPLEQRFSWERLAKPYGDRIFESPVEYRGWLLEYLRRDISEAHRGNVDGPLKAALDALRDLRNEVRLVVDYGGISGDSYRDDLEHWYTPFNAFLSIGPPVSRIEEMMALMEAGVLEIIGPELQIEILRNPARFKAWSSRVKGSCVESTVLIEARLPGVDLKRTTDPLLKYLLQTGQCRPFAISCADGTEYVTGGLEVTLAPNRLVDANGDAHPRRFAFGVPTEGVRWVTAAGIRPGVNSVTLSESDAISREVLKVVAGDLHYVNDRTRKTQLVEVTKR
ncbi:FAD/NAD(P)-binding protein [Alicyclobacillus suci]|uniref:FAD/NAD(P)-binding protein n=1 Tax=Alicyclobacillus suci TaxID=2816080 RepID=UPI001A908063|nr:FAD/NAD(P)-binding protein [Alicyclobacillus suci]